MKIDLNNPHIFSLAVGIIVGITAISVIVIENKKKIEQPEPVENTAQKIEDEPVETKPEPEPYEFPGGGRSLLPEFRMVALYGAPDTPVLGSLGEQSIDKAIARVKELAVQYQPHSKETIYPAFEIIATVASSGPTENNDYSHETSIDKLLPWIEAAEKAGVYVLLDLQPGLNDFLSQAKLYEVLLKKPHVGLALDPEWRLKPGQKHMKQIGSVSSSEINQTANWLADLTAANDLPQKLLLIHQFKLSMISDRQKLDTSREELAWLIQMDGLGSQPVKQDTWRNILTDPPKRLHFGWKNFIDEDKPMLAPKQTMGISPQPFYVSYQ